MKDIIKLLHEKDYSCVIKNRDEIHTFSHRGVKDLYWLLTHNPDLLKGAFAVDKVVGKAAASLWILGGIDELYTDLISRPALQMLQHHNIKISFRHEVPVLLNCHRNDWCPLELLCFKEHSLETIRDKIRDFLHSKTTHENTG
ncbi:MAG: DUF1893 domain-containing protein [Bacteroidales bacterium]|jgi:iron complex outermembrane receptor protein|nr:DUF1893 domain-containing protein [Bacteroidales bacterium]